MKFTAAFIVAYCAIAVCNAGLIYSGTKGPFNKGIDKATNNAIGLTKQTIVDENAKRGDVPNILANVIRAPQAYVNLVTGGLKGVPYTLKDTVGGLSKGLATKGNLLNKLTGALRGTTGGAVTGLQKLYTEAIKNVLTFGRNPKTDPTAAKISEDFERSFKLAVQKRAAAQKGKGNVAGTLKNVYSLASFVTQFLKNTVIQAVPLLQYTVDGTVNGLGKGLKKGGLITGLTGGLAQGTTGLAKGVANGFGKIQQDDMKL